MKQSSIEETPKSRPELHLDAAGRATLDALHDVGQKHMDMVASRHAFHSMNAHFGAGLHTNLAYPLPHRTLQNLVPIYCGPHDMKSMVESRMR